MKCNAGTSTVTKSCCFGSENRMLSLYSSPMDIEYRLANHAAASPGKKVTTYQANTTVHHIRCVRIPSCKTEHTPMSPPMAHDASFLSFHTHFKPHAAVLRFPSFTNVHQSGPKLQAHYLPAVQVSREHII